MNIQLSQCDGIWQLTGDIALAHDGAGVSTANGTSRTVRIYHTLSPSVSYLRHGYGSWSPTRWWYLDRDPWRVWNNPMRTATAEDAATDTPSVHQSYMLTCLELNQGQIFLVGALGARTALFRLRDGEISGSGLDEAEEGAADSGELLEWFFAFGPEHACLAAYAQAVGASVGASDVQLHYRDTCAATPTIAAASDSTHGRHEVETSAAARTYPRHEVGAVWSSWYSWFEEITEEHIASEISAAARSGYEVVQIDDGWEKSVGDWTCNDDFPRGMEGLVKQINDAGMTAGLWISPFIALADTPVVKEHPEYFVADADGCPAVAGYNWGQAYYAIDCTHPEAMAWVLDVIDRAYRWGFRYFKFDFLNAAAMRGHRYQQANREDAYRMGLEAIRQHIPDCYIMASGAVVAASIGLVDGMRVGPDTAPYWDNMDRHRDPSGPAVRNALRNSVTRYWLSSVVDIDPDVAYARTRGSLLSPEVNAITQDMARVCGVFGCSDPDAWLTDDERAIIASCCRSFKDGKRPQVEQLSRYVFGVDGRRVDFEPWINPSGRVSDRLLVK